MASNTNYDESHAEVFDYVIIGGGTAGLTLAARLTEDPTISVAVLEAGEKRPDVHPPPCAGCVYSSPAHNSPGSQHSHP